MFSPALEKSFLISAFTGEVHPDDAFAGEVHSDILIGIISMRSTLGKLTMFDLVMSRRFVVLHPV